ncbi:class I fructose-bisphosphate aldolase, partial [Enterobacter hormaechei subsp. steigerwaltii]
NHNETLSYPTEYDQTLYASVEQAFNMGAVAVGATIYFGSEPSRRQIEEISAAFERAHELGMVTVLWAYLRNASFKKDGVDYLVSADLTGQANHLAATIGADIVKQKMAENNGGYKAVNFGYTDDRVYSKLTSDNPIDLVRYQLANCYMGRAGLINSGGAAGGETDLTDAVRTAVINKRAGGMGLILGRKAFKKSMADGVKLINAVQDVYLDSKVTIA